MATTPVTLNGVTYFVPQPGEAGPTYDQNLTNYLIALATAFPQTSGGGVGFTVLASATANPATAGQIRLAHTDTVAWRNNANSGNLLLGVGQSVAGGVDDLSFNGTELTGQSAAVYRIATPQTLITTATTVNFDTALYDSDSAVTTGAAWHFQPPVSKFPQFSVWLVSAVVNTLQVTAPGVQTITIQMAGGTSASWQTPLAVAAAANASIAICAPLVATTISGGAISASVATSAGTLTTVAGATSSVISIKRMV